MNPLELDPGDDPHVLPALVAYARSIAPERSGESREIVDRVVNHCYVGLYRVEFRQDRPPIWILAESTMSAVRRANDCTGGHHQPKDTAYVVPVSDYPRFYAGSTKWPMLMRQALYSAEFVEMGGDWQPVVVADGTVRAGDGEVREPGAMEPAE